MATTSEVFVYKALTDFIGCIARFLTQFDVRCCQFGPKTAKIIKNPTECILNESAGSVDSYLYKTLSRASSIETMFLRAPMSVSSEKNPLGLSPFAFFWRILQLLKIWYCHLYHTPCINY